MSFDHSSDLQQSIDAVMEKEFGFKSPIPSNHLQVAINLKEVLGVQNAARMVGLAGMSGVYSRWIKGSASPTPWQVRYLLNAWSIVQILQTKTMSKSKIRAWIAAPNSYLAGWAPRDVMTRDYSMVRDAAIKWLMS